MAEMSEIKSSIYLSIYLSICNDVLTCEIRPVTVAHQTMAISTDLLIQELSEANHKGRRSGRGKAAMWLYHECVMIYYKIVERLDFLLKDLFHQIMFVVRFILGYYQHLYQV